MKSQTLLMTLLSMATGAWARPAGSPHLRPLRVPWLRSRDPEPAALSHVTLKIHVYLKETGMWPK